MQSHLDCTVPYPRGMPTEFAPLVVFAYRRPKHLARCLSALRRNRESSRSPLIIFCDGPKGPEDADAVLRTREVAWGVEGFASVRVVVADRNKGLAPSVIDGVTQVLNDYSHAIVVEDDLMVSVDFLAYMNEGLALYKEDPRVVSIHGFLPAVDVELPQSFFLRGADCWGWATWRRAWSEIDFDSKTLLESLETSPDRLLFDFDGAYPYLKMLRDQVDGKIDSWAIRWYASAFLQGKLTLHPGSSLVTNTGMGGMGTHTGVVEGLRSSAQRIDLPLRAIDVHDDLVAREAIATALRGRPSMVKRIIRWLRVRGMDR